MSRPIYHDFLDNNSELKVVFDEILPSTGHPDMDNLLKDCLKILGQKGRDYRNGSTDLLANFKEAGKFVGLTPEQVWAVYFYKHIAAIFNYVKTGGKSESEPIEGRLADAINYLLLFSARVAEVKRQSLESSE